MQNNTSTTELKPERSQTLLVSICVVIAFLVTGSVTLLLSGLIAGYFFLAAAFVLTAALLFFWDRGRLDNELANAKQTELKIGDTSITADPRTIRGAEDIGLLLNHLAFISQRHPLPKPAGMVDNNQNPIAGTENEAITQVSEINRADQELKEKISKRLNQNFLPPNQSYQEMLPGVQGSSPPKE